jgi:hypothetical protein
MLSTGDGWASSFAEVCVMSGGPAASPVCFFFLVCHRTLESEKNKRLFICFKRVFMGGEDALTRQKKQQQVMQYWSTVDLHEPIFLLVLLLRQTWEVF